MTTIDNTYMSFHCTYEKLENSETVWQKKSIQKFFAPWEILFLEGENHLNFSPGVRAYSSIFHILCLKENIVSRIVYE